MNLKMNDMLKIKHLIWTIGGMLVFAFGLGMNVNTKLSQVEANTTGIHNNSVHIQKIETEYHDYIKETNKNYIDILTAVKDLRLELKLELKDKKNREDVQK